MIIYKIIKGNKVEFRMSDKLKSLILMAYSQNKLYENKSHEVYLIYPQWLKQYKYKKIFKLIKENYEKIQNLNISYNDLKSAFEITRYLNQHDVESEIRRFVHCTIRRYIRNMSDIFLHDIPPPLHATVKTTE